MLGVVVRSASVPSLPSRRRADDVDGAAVGSDDDVPRSGARSAGACRIVTVDDVRRCDVDMVRGCYMGREFNLHVWRLLLPAILRFVTPQMRRGSGLFLDEGSARITNGLIFQSERHTTARRGVFRELNVVVY